MKKQLYHLSLIFCFSLFSTTTWSQQLRPVEKLVTEKLQNNAATVYGLFSKESNTIKKANLPTSLLEAELLALDNKAVAQLRERAPEVLELSVPSAIGVFELQLVKQEVTAPDFSVITDVSSAPADYVPGIHYRGIVKGQSNSLVSMSIFRDEVMAIISTNEGNFNLGRLENDLTTYVIYNDKKLSAEKGAICATPELPEGMKIKIDADDAQKATVRCVKVYIETDYDLYQNKGSVANVTNYITGLFNQVATLYQNENITTQISQIYVWTSTDPYTGSTSTEYLTKFRTTRTSFTGDLAHLVNITGNLGGVAYVDVLCNNSYRYAFSSIYTSYSTVPTYSWSVEVFTHEMGHNLGSNHTHSCSWSGGAIDNCYTPEGVCTPGPAPTNGGTIMSYCHLTSYGINFNNGFGPLPGAKIRSEVTGASCLGTCEVGGTVCNVPLDITESAVSQSSFTLSWPAATGAVSYEIRYRQQGTSSWTTTTSTTTSKTISGLSSSTTYEYQVRSSCGGTTFSAWSAINTATTYNVLPSYCASKGNDASAEWIWKVQIGSWVNQTVSDNGYGDYTNLSLSMLPGTSAAISLTPRFPVILGLISQQQPEIWRVWVDFNKDGDFLDANELVFATSSTSSATVHGTVTVPSTTTPGITRMRVSMKRSTASTSCETFAFGEVEDYTFIIPNSMPPAGANVPFASAHGLSSSVHHKLKIYPNPTTEMSSIEFTVLANSGVNTFQVLDITGKVIEQQQFISSDMDTPVLHTLNMSGQPKGMYFISVVNERGDRKVEKLSLQ